MTKDRFKELIGQETRRNRNHRLTAGQRTMIRLRRGERGVDLAREYGVSPAAITQTRAPKE